MSKVYMNGADELWHVCWGSLGWPCEMV